jgi:antitoxin component of RelBE/YafQ-DinJ toxin-antitoxin module
MASKNITLKVSEDLYDHYKEFCKKKGLIISRQFEIFMEEQINNDSEKKNG